MSGYRLRTHHGQENRLTPSAQVAQATSPRPWAAGGARGEGGGGANASGSGTAEARRRASAAAETFENVYNLVREHYVDPLPSATRMSQGTVRGMIAALNDPNSYFLEPAEMRVFDAEADGRFAGVGAVTALRSVKKDGVTEHKIAVVAPLPGSPAEHAGLKPGDVITHVDGKWILGASPLLDYNRVLKQYQAEGASEEDLDKAAESARERIRAGLGLHKAVNLLRRGTGEKRVLTVEREGAAKPLRIELTTANTKVEPVTARTITVNGRSAAYVRVAALTQNAGDAFARALEGLPPADGGVVLDLRGNPGGSLEAAQAIDAYLSRGGPFLVETVAGGRRNTLGSPSSSRSDLPRVAVLVDRGTGSTAEALAASLADKQNAPLLGARTFGDGLVQTLYPLSDGSGFTLTTGRMSGPRGTAWDRVGLAPRVSLPAGLTEEAVVARALDALDVPAAARTAAGRPAR